MFYQGSALLWIDESFYWGWWFIWHHCQHFLSYCFFLTLKHSFRILGVLFSSIYCLTDCHFTFVNFRRPVIRDSIRHFRPDRNRKFWGQLSLRQFPATAKGRFARLIYLPLFLLLIFCKYFGSLIFANESWSAILFVNIKAAFRKGFFFFSQGLCNTFTYWTKHTCNTREQPYQSSI